VRAKETPLAIEYQAIRKEGLSTQIANAIRKAILDGALSVEERLPSETELADRFGVSRATVREAMKRLAAQNLIRSESAARPGARSSIASRLMRPVVIWWVRPGFSSA
jgi:GntR family transcriptional repressor for pyruvate dehydrogenase complex